MKFFLKVLVLLGIVALATLVTLYVVRGTNDSDPHRVIKSEVELNADQQKELIAASHTESLLYRHRSSEGIWRVQVGGNPPPAADALVLGKLFSAPEVEQVDQPLYLCSYSGFASENLSLDRSPQCSGDGNIVTPDPVGFVSAKVRTGFLLLFRCLSRSHGFYLSLNARCEDPQDMVQAALGSIRAAR